MPIDYKETVKVLYNLIDQSYNERKLSSNEEVQNYLMNLMTQKQYSFIHEIDFIVSDIERHSYIISRKGDSIQSTIVKDKKQIPTFVDWYRVDIERDEIQWSQPRYTSHGSDRGYLLHYTGNIFDPDSSNVKVVLNITCKGKLRKRSIIDQE